jgi:hypothetical protein
MQEKEGQTGSNEEQQNEHPAVLRSSLRFSKLDIPLLDRRCSRNRILVQLIRQFCLSRQMRH